MRQRHAGHRRRGSAMAPRPRRVGIPRKLQVQRALGGFAVLRRCRCPVTASGAAPARGGPIAVQRASRAAAGPVGARRTARECLRERSRCDRPAHAAGRACDTRLAATPPSAASRAAAGRRERTRPATMPCFSSADARSWHGPDAAAARVRLADPIGEGSASARRRAHARAALAPLDARLHELRRARRPPTSTMAPSPRASIRPPATGFSIGERNRSPVGQGSHANLRQPVLLAHQPRTAARHGLVIGLDDIRGRNGSSSRPASRVKRRTNVVRQRGAQRRQIISLSAAASASRMRCTLIAARMVRPCASGSTALTTAATAPRPPTPPSLSLPRSTVRRANTDSMWVLSDRRGRPAPATAPPLTGRPRRRSRRC